MDVQPAYYCPVCNARLDAAKVIGPNLDGTVPPHDDEQGEFEWCDGVGAEPVVCDHAERCPDDCPGSVESERWAPSIRSPHGAERTRTYRGLILVVRLPPSFPSWAAYRDVDRRVYVNGGQAAGIRDAERRAFAVIDEDFRTEPPPCLTGMGCLCAGHARGDAPQVRCDTDEQPGGRPEGAVRRAMFERGVVAVFKSLSWDYRRHLPCMFGKRIILRRVFDTAHGFCHVNHRSACEIDDLMRALCILDRKPEPDHRQGAYHRLSATKLDLADFDGYFTVKGYKNGNGHLTFLRSDLVDQMNQIIGRHFPGVLPPARD